MLGLQERSPGAGVDHADAVDCELPPETPVVWVGDPEPTDGLHREVVAGDEHRLQGVLDQVVPRALLRL